MHSKPESRTTPTVTHSQGWIFGENYKIYNYDVFDPNQNLFGGLRVFEIDPANFQLRRRLFATRARWSEPQHVWVLEGGWMRDFSDGSLSHYEGFMSAASHKFTERPGYVHRWCAHALQHN